MSNPQNPSSFKDPSGFVFKKDNLFYRQVNKVYSGDYDLLMSSGLYDDLIGKKILLPHVEIDENLSGSSQWYKTLLPEQLFFTTYPWEWCFDQLKDAALLTLAVQKKAIRHGMILKDATSLNVQFQNGKPVFIDTLSFEKYDPTKPWVAYRQFCECFLFPLFIQQYRAIESRKLLLAWADGIPAEIAKELLPWKSNFNLGVALHVSLQSKIKTAKKDAGYKGEFDQGKMLQLVSNLEQNIKRCTPKKSKTVWSNYYDETICSGSYLTEKEKIVRAFAEQTSFKTIIDVGANDGHFSKMISGSDCSVVAIDSDAACIKNLYEFVRGNKVRNILPLVVDIANPTPSTGFNNLERPSFLDRSHFDLALGLALVHHLAIAKNIPFDNIARLFRQISDIVIIEFIPKEDPKVVQLFEHRKDIFSDYNLPSFEKAFEEYFTIISKEKVIGSERTMYLLKSK